MRWNQAKAVCAEIAQKESYDPIERREGKPGHDERSILMRVRMRVRVPGAARGHSDWT